MFSVDEIIFFCQEHLKNRQNTLDKEAQKTKIRLMHPIQEKLYELVHHRGRRKFDSLRDLGEAIGEVHPQKIKHHLQQLEKSGLITVNWEDYSIQPKPDPQQWHEAEVISIPIMGAANCGTATLFAEERPEGMLMASKAMIKGAKKNVFALRAVGNSMNKADSPWGPIENGDYVIIDPDDRQPKNNDFVVSIINGSANIKRFYKDEEHSNIVLFSDSTETYLPIFIHFEDNPDFFINGKVVSVIKQPKMTVA